MESLLPCEDTECCICNCMCKCIGADLYMLETAGRISPICAICMIGSGIQDCRGLY